MAEDEPRWYYVGNGELRLKDADGWTEQYKTIESPLAKTMQTDPTAQPDPEQPDQVARTGRRRGLGRLVGAALVMIAGVGAAFTTGVLQLPGSMNASVDRDANGFAVGGPVAPGGPVNYKPSRAYCLTYRDQLRAWSTYQNAHRAAGSTTQLPRTSDVQYLYVVCGLKF